MKSLIAIADGLMKVRDLPLLLLRLILVIGFWQPFLFKLEDPTAFGQFLATIGVPGALFWAYVVLICEGLGILLLFFGFATRLITLPLMAIMVVAIVTVHWSHGFDACHGGFQIPLYFLLMLFTIFIIGPGAISIDGLIARPYRKKSPH